MKQRHVKEAPIMLNIDEAQQLMDTLIDLRTKANESKSTGDIRAFKAHQAICVEKFSYLVTMKTGRYKDFPNYDDLNQEGFEALLKGMNNYNPKKGNAFWWFHKYIQTRISRSANLHTAIRYPLKVAKNTAPHKEAIMPILIEEQNCPDKELERAQITRAIRDSVVPLHEDQMQIINLVYGLDGDKPMSINKVCNKLGMSRSNCIKIIGNALSVIRENIKL